MRILIISPDLPPLVSRLRPHGDTKRQVDIEAAILIHSARKGIDMRYAYMSGPRWRWWRSRYSWYQRDDTRTFGRVFPVDRRWWVETDTGDVYRDGPIYYQRGRRRGFHRPPAVRVGSVL